jgi:hypothetical protein
MIAQKFSCRISLILCWLVYHNVALNIQANAPVSAAESSQVKSTGSLEDFGLQLEVSIGLGGKWKVGSTTSIRLNGLANRERNGYLAIEAVDGDGVPVRYFYPEHLQFALNEKIELEWIFRAGRGDAEAHLIWIEAPQDNSLDTRRSAGKRVLSFFPAEIATPLPSHQPWVVEIGELKMGLEAGFQSRTTLPRYSTSTITKFSELPEDASAYHGIDLIALSTSDFSLVESISEKEHRPITEFVRGGGRLFVALGKNSLEVNKLPWLAELLPGPIRTIVPNVNASTIESMIGTSKQRLEALPMPVLQLTRGISDFSITLPDRQRIQVITRSGFGLGQVLTFSADLNLPPLSEWEDRPALIQRLLQDQWVVADQELGATAATSNSYLGYDDLFGQLRASLDIFPEVQIISFSYLAILLILLMLILGPVEYYLWIKGLNRSGWTWLSLLAVVAFSSWLMIRQYDQRRPKIPLSRGVEVIDMEASTGFQRGRMWFHTYHSAPAQLDFAAKVKSIGVDGQVTSSSLDWQPLPGRGIGGLESGIRSLEQLPPYAARIIGSLPDNSEIATTAKLQTLPFPAGSTKSLRVDWTGRAKPIDFGNLREITGSGLIQGDFVNALDVELLDAVIIYRNLVYALPPRMKSGASESITILSTPKDLERRLTRRVARDGKDVTAPWDPADRNSIGLLMDMIFFYEAAGGEKYTRLQHRFEPSLDMSDLLSLDRAILLARLPESASQVQISSPAGENSFRPEASTFIRCILPIGRSK